MQERGFTYTVLLSGYCQSTGDTYIDLKDIQSAEYEAGKGTSVKDGQGNSHVIEHDGVARHPGDKGQAEIAKRILSAL